MYEPGRKFRLQLDPTCNIKNLLELNNKIVTIEKIINGGYKLKECKSWLVLEYELIPIEENKYNISIF